MIRVHCPDCNKKYGVPENILGKKVTCKDCGTQFTLEPQARAPQKNHTERRTKAPSKKPTSQKSSSQKVSSQKPNSQKAPRKKDPQPSAPRTRLPRNRKADAASGLRRNKSDGKQLKEIITQLRNLEDFPRPRPTIMHRLTALFVACMMLILPMIYIAFVYFIGRLTWWHTTNNYVWLSHLRGRAVIYGAILYGFLVIAGFLWVLSLIKPIFMRIYTESSDDSLERKDDPALFDFADAIAEITGSPKPDRINFTYEVNASASYETKFFGLFRKNFTLTLGIPLIAGMNVDELAGIIAHEFGHFSQRGSTLIQRFIQRINMWFYLAVFERGSVDELISSTNDDDDSFSILGFILWILVGMGRIVLWILMHIGLLFSSSLLRRMEYDADRYETGLIGSEGFKKSSKKLVSLMLAHNFAAEYTLGSHQGTMLPDNLPEFTAGIASRSKMISKKMTKMIRTEKHGFFNSHPTTLSRIEAAKKLNLPGTFKCKTPASKLIKNWSRRCRNCSIAIYGMYFGGAFDIEAMKPTSMAITDYLEAMK